MSKQGYMWYTSNWNNSDRVFELYLEGRGLYRELIDRAMHNDNVVVFDLKKMSRRLNTSEADLNKILQVLLDLNLVVNKEEGLFLPECEKRLNLIRGGHKGGKKSRKSKPIDKPISKPMGKPVDKPMGKQSKVNRNININNNNKVDDAVVGFQKKIDSYVERIGSNEEVLYRESFYRCYKIKKNSLHKIIDEFKIHLNLHKPEHTDNYSYKEFKVHFSNWTRIKHNKGELSKYQSTIMQKGDL